MFNTISRWFYVETRMEKSGEEKLNEEVEPYWNMVRFWYETIYFPILFYICCFGIIKGVVHSWSSHIASRWASFGRCGGNNAIIGWSYEKYELCAYAWMGRVFSNILEVFLKLCIVGRLLKGHGKMPWYILLALYSLLSIWTCKEVYHCCFSMLGIHSNAHDMVL